MQTQIMDEKVAIAATLDARVAAAAARAAAAAAAGSAAGADELQAARWDMFADLRRRNALQLPGGPEAGVARS
jgi:hypothetical protein